MDEKLRLAQVLAIQTFSFTEFSGEKKLFSTSRLSFT